MLKNKGEKRYSVTIYQFVIAAVFGLLIAGCVGHFEDDDTEIVEYVLHGQILSHEGDPLEEMQVTADGVTADNFTDSEGWFTVTSPFEFEDKVSITISGRGFKAAEFIADISDEYTLWNGEKEKEIEPIPVSKKPQPAFFDIVSPQDHSMIDLDECCDGKVEIRGVVSLPPRDNLYLDVVFAVDVSGSVGKKDIFSQEIDAAKALLNELNSNTTRVAVVQFASKAEIIQELTGDLDEIESTFETMLDEGPKTFGREGGATHYADALHSAMDIHKSSPIEYVDSSTNEIAEAEPLRIVIFISDGIPTLPAYSGMSQEKADIEATLAAARLLKAHEISVFAYAFNVDKSESKLTTLPAIAAITGGRYAEVDNPEDAVLVVPNTSFVDMNFVVLENVETGAKVTVSTTPDGFFQGAIDIGPDRQTIRISAWDFDDLNETTTELTVIGEYDVEKGVPAGLAELPVAERGTFSPYEIDLDNDNLYELLMGSYGEYTDAHEATNTEVFEAQGREGEDVTLSG
ncbi:MAG: VWA domain-containing protein [Proteobacteria bacterium]|nr:VWA domain-containing protein [Pseudomonadota bacterium]